MRISEITAQASMAEDIDVCLGAKKYTAFNRVARTKFVFSLVWRGCASLWGIKHLLNYTGNQCPKGSGGASWRKEVQRASCEHYGRMMILH